MNLTLKILNKVIRIHSENQIVLEDIVNTFSYFLVDDSDMETDIDILVEEETVYDYRIIYDGKMSACAKVNLYPKLCEIIRRALILKTDYFCFHAAAVEKNGKSFIFISTGNSGKSTLCTALLFRGYKLISDDTCWINPNDGTIYPYPLAIGIRPKTLEILPSLKKYVIGTSFPGKLILPISKDWVAYPCKAFAYFLWELDVNNQKFILNQIDNEELCFNLLGHSFSYKYAKNKKEIFTKLLNTITDNCYTLKGHNLSVLPEVLDNLDSAK